MSANEDSHALQVSLADVNAAFLVDADAERADKLPSAEVAQQLAILAEHVNAAVALVADEENAVVVEGEAAQQERRTRDLIAESAQHFAVG